MQLINERRWWRRWSYNILFFRLFGKFCFYYIRIAFISQAFSMHIIVYKMMIYSFFGFTQGVFLLFFASCVCFFSLVCAFRSFFNENTKKTPNGYWKLSVKMHSTCYIHFIRMEKEHYKWTHAHNSFDWPSINYYKNILNECWINAIAFFVYSNTKKNIHTTITNSQLEKNTKSDRKCVKVFFIHAYSGVSVCVCWSCILHSSWNIYVFCTFLTKKTQNKIEIIYYIKCIEGE